MIVWLARVYTQAATHTHTPIHKYMNTDGVHMSLNKYTK